MKRLAVLGASGHGKVIAEIAELLGWNVTFFDDAFPEISKLEVWQVKGTTADLLALLSGFDGCIVAIGNNEIRLDKTLMLEAKQANLVALIHPSAVVSQYSQIGDGAVVMAGAVINPFASIGLASIINTGATVDHDCVLGDGVHISPGANVAGTVSIGNESWVGIGAIIKQGLLIGEKVTVGAGAVVVSNLPSNVVAIGVPAKVKK